MTVKLPKTWSYLQRWFLFGIVIGVVSGLGAEAFNLLLRFVTEVFLVGVLNYTPPVAGGEGLTVFPNLSDLR
jgi:CIC family chloride channel protein